MREMRSLQPPRWVVCLAAAWLLLPAAALARPKPTAVAQFFPGKTWLDTNGKPINAHGGGMLVLSNTYYWYGENKAGRSWLPDANKSWSGYRVEVTGIRCYSSTNLYAWQDQGLVLRADPADPNSDLHPSRVVERPKVAFNPRTRKFVMWMHIDSADYQSARAGVAVAETPAGPFQYLGSVKPEGADSRDQTLFVDDDSQAYRIYSSEWNKATYISLLTDDWLKHAGRYVKVFPNQSLEAYALCKRNGKYYLFASGCTGWDPNPAHVAVADSIWGEWRELGNPCQGPGADTTFASQGTCIFPVAGQRDAFIFMADRWNKTDLADSRYVWLPIRFGERGPTVAWQDQWNLSFFARAQSPTPPGVQPDPRAVSGPVAHPPFSLQSQNGVDWLVRPDGRPFFSLGVCCVNMGVSRNDFTSTNPGYAAWQHYPNSNAWAKAVSRRLKSWGFTTLGGWSDYPTLKAQPGMDAAMTPVLHMGSSAGAPWLDMWDAAVTGRMEQIARDQILQLRDDPRLLGYYSDNEMGWWNSALFKMALEQPPTSGQRQRLMQLLGETYHRDWPALLRDFDPEGAGDWLSLEQRGILYLRSGGNGLHVIRDFAALLADRYYSLVRQIIRKYDQRALILGDRYQSFYYPEVARAGGRYLDALSSNLNAAWNDGTYPRFYLQTLHDLSGKPLFVGEFYLAARDNRSGDGNDRGVFPIVASQRERAAGFTATARALLQSPYVVGADWFQYYDEPPHGRPDGENYNFGLVDIYDRPYRPLTTAAARLSPISFKHLGAPRRPDARLGVPRAPRAPLADFQPMLALKQWDRERGFVQPISDYPMADLYLCWGPQALYVGIYSQDVVEDAFYRGKTVPESERSEWTIAFNDRAMVIRARIGAGESPVVSQSSAGEVRLSNLSGKPSAVVVNSSGINLNVRNIAALELPAALLGRQQFKAGDTLRLSSSFVTHGRGYRTEWQGEFKLAD